MSTFFFLRTEIPAHDVLQFTGGNSNNRRPHLFVECLRFFPLYFATIFTIFFGT